MEGRRRVRLVLFVTLLVSCSKLRRAVGERKVVDCGGVKSEGTRGGLTWDHASWQAAWYAEWWGRYRSYKDKY